MNSASSKVLKVVSRCGRAVFWPDICIIDEHDENARQIQADLDAEHQRQQRSMRQIYYPPGTMAARRLADTDIGGDL